MGIISDKLLQSSLERKEHEEDRLYLGFSIVGHPCRRYLWLDYHKKELKSKPSPKTCRIWDNGHAIEKKLIHEMRQSGFEITAQQMEMSLFDGKFKGHPEGLTTIEPHGKVVFEIKGLKQSEWNKYNKHGVKATSPTYYGQAIMLAGYLNLPGTYWIAENKDNCDLYEEFIPANFTEYSMLCRKAEAIIHGEIPQGISERRDFWKCFNCQFNHDDACRREWNKEKPF